MITLKKKKDSLLKSFEKFVSSSVADTKTIMGGDYAIFRVNTSTGIFFQHFSDNGSSYFTNMIGRVWTPDRLPE